MVSISVLYRPSSTGRKLSPGTSKTLFTLWACRADTIACPTCTVSLAEDIDMAFQISTGIKIQGGEGEQCCLRFLANDVVFDSVFLTDESTNCSNECDDDQDDNARNGAWLLISGIHPCCQEWKQT